MPTARTSPIAFNQARFSNSNSIFGAIFGFTIGFGLATVFFLVMDGVEFFRSIAYGTVEWVTVDGKVDWQRDSGTRSIFGDVDEFQVRYTVDGKEYTSRCYSVKRPEEFVIEHDNNALGEVESWEPTCTRHRASFWYFPSAFTFCCCLDCLAPSSRFYSVVAIGELQQANEAAFVSMNRDADDEGANRFQKASHRKP